MAGELKPCPFCGGEAEEFTENDSRIEPLVPGHNCDVFVNNDYFGVKCKKCDVAQSNPFVEREYATTAWNTRPLEDDLTARCEKLREALDALFIQAIQSSVSNPENEWGREALEQARAALSEGDG